MVFHLAMIIARLYYEVFTFILCFHQFIATACALVVMTTGAHAVAIYVIAYIYVWVYISSTYVHTHCAQCCHSSSFHLHGRLDPEYDACACRAVMTARSSLVRAQIPKMQAPGRKGSWHGDPTMLAGIIGRHLSSPSALVYGDNPKTAKVEPERSLKFTVMWRELQKTCPNLSFKKKDLLVVFTHLLGLFL